MASHGGEDVAVIEMLGFSLERLNKEPELLQADSDRVRRQMLELAVSKYDAFLSAADCTAAVRTEVAGIRQHLQALQQGLPSLSAGCTNFAEAAERIAAARGQNRQLLQQHGTLLDLLEVGSLLDTCVRNGSYDEALDLEAFCGKLCASAPGVPLAEALSEGARAGVRLMLAQLLQRLRGSVQLPECLRSVGYLRRLGAFAEPELRLAFLRCRDDWLTTCCAELDSSVAYEYAKRLTDTHRVHLFDCVMQYRAIFADDTSAADAAAEGGLVYAWAAHRVRAYLEELASCVPRLSEGAALAGVLEHCSYCGASLGRVGLDFRGLLPPMFEAAVQALVSRALVAAVEGFERSLGAHRWAAQSSAAAAAVAAAAAAAPLRPCGDDAAPPPSLLEHAPVAVLVNGVLAALNELRHCPLPVLRTPLASALHDALSSACGVMVRYSRAQVHSDVQQPLLEAAARALADVAAPYLAASFGRVYDASAATLVDVEGACTAVRALG